MVILRSGVIFVEPIILRNPAIKTEEGDKETNNDRAEDAGSDEKSEESAKIT